MEPKDPSGSFGNNDRILKFGMSGIGADTSNDNDFSASQLGTDHQVR